jgi:hypothetical protein
MGYMTDRHNAVQERLTEAIIKHRKVQRELNFAKQNS